MNELYELYALGESVDRLMTIMQTLGILSYILLIAALLIPYIVMGYMIMCIGRKARLDADWMPFVPIARQLYQMQIADCPWWYIFLFGGCFVNWAITGILILIFGLMFEKVIVTILVVCIYALATLVFTFFYYRNYYEHFGFNRNTAWIEVIWSFAVVRVVLLVFVAFSDSICYRLPGGNPMPFNDGGQGGTSRAPAGRPAQAPRRPDQSAAVEGVAGKYAGAYFDISDGAEVIFGRSSADANIVFDQFETDISRKHCSVRYDAMSDQFVVTDFSTNGTYAENGSRFDSQQPVSVARGSIIYLGKNKKNSFRLG